MPTGDDPEEVKGYNDRKGESKVIQDDVSTGEVPTIQSKSTEEQKSNINTNSQSDKVNPTHKVISSDKAKQVYKMCKGDQNILSTVLKKYGYETTFQITENKLDFIINEIKKVS